MAGLIQQQMAPKADEQNEQEPVEGMGPDGSAQHEGMEGEQPESGDQSAGENDPVFKKAIEFAMDALYNKGAAKDISSQLKSAPSLVEGMASVSYDITSIVDEKTQGQVPDELLVPLAMKVLEEIVEIAEATGLDPQPEDVAGAFKQMILRYLQEQGVDTSQLDQAMSQVDPSLFREAAGEEKAEV